MWTKVKNRPTEQQTSIMRCGGKKKLDVCARVTERAATWRKKSDGQTSSQPIICLFEETGIKLRH